MLDFEQREQRIQTVAAYAIGGVVCFLVAPFIFGVVKGLIGLIVAAVIGFTAIQFTPYFARLVANWRLKAIKAEAAKNPIETLENDYGSRMEALKQFRESIRNFAGSVRSFAEKLDGFKQSYPKDAPKFDEQLRSMRALLEFRKKKYEQACGNLELYEREIQKARAIWDMAQEAAKMNRASGIDAEDFFAKISVETALDSVQKGMCTAFSDLELALVEEKMDAAQVAAPSEVAALPEPRKGNPLSLDLDNVREVEPIKVTR